jgi:hypothetical protein
MKKIIYIFIITLLLLIGCEDITNDRTNEPTPFPYKLVSDTDGEIKTEYEIYYFTEGEERLIYVYGNWNRTWNIIWDYVWLESSDYYTGTQDYSMIWQNNDELGRWLEGDYDKFAAPIKMRAPDYTGTYNYTLHAGPIHHGSSSNTYAFTVEVVEDRDYDYCYSYVKTTTDINLKF